MDEGKQEEDQADKSSSSSEEEIHTSYTHEVHSVRRKRKKSRQKDGEAGHEEKRKTDEQRKAQRRAANRISASRSRKRFKDLVKDLQKSVETLSKSNKELRNEGNELSGKLKVAMLENQLLKKQCLGVTPPTVLDPAVAAPVPVILPQHSMIPAQVVTPPPPVFNYAVLAGNAALGASGPAGFAAGGSQAVAVARPPAVVQSSLIGATSLAPAAAQILAPGASLHQQAAPLGFIGGSNTNNSIGISSNTLQSNQQLSLPLQGTNSLAQTVTTAENNPLTVALAQANNPSDPNNRAPR